MEITDGRLSYFREFLSSQESTELLAIWLETLPWSQDKIRIFGKWLDIPRLQCWFGDPGATYAYSGLSMHPKPWTEELMLLKAKIEALTNSSYNSVLVNLYRDGKDSNGWHSDDEKELGENPTIASLSLGSSRVFQLKHKATGERRNILLESGSLLIMSGELQKNWKHQIPKKSKIFEPRINLTFRKILF